MPESGKLGKADIETPALLVDLDIMEQNLETMARFFCNRPAKLRPHFKNHRVLELAARQMEHGAIGITCARLWQGGRAGQLWDSQHPDRQRNCRRSADRALCRAFARSSRAGCRRQPESRCRYGTPRAKSQS